MWGSFLLPFEGTKPILSQIRVLVANAEQYTCYDTDFLCPVLNDEPTLRCGLDCYLPSMYS